MSGPVVLWFRRDLRLADHGALHAACELAGRTGVVGLFVHDRRAAAGAGPNRLRFLAGSLAALDAAMDGRLAVRAGAPEVVVPAVAAEVGADVVVVTADAGPYGRRRDRQVDRALQAAGRRLVAAGSPYAAAPGSLRTGNGTPYQVFTPYLRAWEAAVDRRPLPVLAVRWVDAAGEPGSPAAGDAGQAAAGDPGGAAAGDPGGAGARGPADHGLPDWWADLPLGPAPDLPAAGEAAALDRLTRFAEGPLADYATARDRPDRDGTTRLSAHLHFGCVHPRTVLDALDDGPGGRRLAAELAWRDFYADVLWHHPSSAWAPLAPAGRHLRWDDGPDARRRFAAWATGTTGFPLVDAGMRQLLAEGWMHNRVRMVAASLLVKDLHLDWRWGARWFLWHLVDGDLASNNHGWQWVAGTGTDAAPFHRVFNPGRQRERFDPDGTYVARHLPEAGGFGYPGPVVDHAAERHEALARWEDARRRAAGEP